MKKLLMALFALTLVFGLSACGTEEEPEPVIEEGTGYGLVHSHYVGIATVTLEDGIVTDASLEEYFLPYSWAKLEVVTEESDELGENEDVFQFTAFGTTYNMAVYVQIGDKLFSGENVDGSPVWSTDDIADLEEWLKVEENAKWYVDQVDEGNWYIANADGTESDYETLETDASATSIIKSESGYWDFGHLGWQGNVDATVDAVIGLDLSEDYDLERLDEDEDELRFWAIDDTVTGATWSDFPDYFGILVRAYNNAE